MVVLEECSDVLSSFPGGIRLTVRAKPGTAKTGPVRLVDCGEGRRAIEIGVTVQAQNGAANAALLARLSTVFGVKKSAISLKKGRTGRLKIFEIFGDSQTLLRRVKAALSAAQ